MKTYRIVNATRFFLFLGVTAALFIVFSLRILAPREVSGASYSMPKTVVVASGDTVWTIAEKAVGNRGGHDIRRVVHEINRINEIEDAKIFPGQKLLIPEL